ncbi:unnamed protein product [Effrenium voratum]|uniref:Myosin motor domain-containing protein n=1 Tax=Effrenium voratum TaxID=2562239 RepID=A0AA36I4J0_9DINO|nr:unnamed protein product [Effrenium voratum]CAJ1449454.1 unnamed protein product [Effrenium voratum]
MAARQRWSPGDAVWLPDKELAFRACVAGDGQELPAALRREPRFPAAGYADAVELRWANEANLLENLCLRYRQGQIYTNVSHVLLAINPHRQLPHLYGESMMKQAGPHPYTVAALALRRRRQGPQAIVVSGESGAGKTETAKIIMRYLEVTSQKELPEKLTAVSRVLESLGHAETRQNPNSSRFGKYLTMRIGRHSISTQVTTYMLEASRVIAGGRNFHIFYEALGAEPGLGPAWAARRKELEAALEALGLQALTTPLLRAVAGIWRILQHLREGEIEEDEVSEMASACQLLGLSFQSLQASLRHRRLRVGAEDLALPRAAKQRGALLRGLAVAAYSRLFHGVVRRMSDNLADLGPEEEELGILDMYGFEDLQNNQLEQLLINYTNERLQLFFCDQLLVKEQQLCLSEGLKLDLGERETSGRQVLDNLDIVLNVLDDCSMQRLRSGGGGEALELLLRRTGEARRRGHVAGRFAVRHYAGEVTYLTSGWLDANDSQPLPEVAELLQTSSNDLLHLERQTSKRPCQSVNKRHRSDLEALMKKLSAMGVHFIRCFRPNKEQSADFVDRGFLLQQLRGCGVHQVLQVMQRGFPHRVSLQQVAARLPGGFSERVGAEVLMVALQVPRSDWRVGVTQLFLKAAHRDALEALLADDRPLDPALLQEAARRSRRLRWRRAFHALSLVRFLSRGAAQRARSAALRRKLRAALLAAFFLCAARRAARARRLAAKADGLQVPAPASAVLGTIRSETPEDQTGTLLEQAKSEKAERALRELARPCKRRRPSKAVSVEGGVLLEMLPKRRLCLVEP